MTVFPAKGRIASESLNQKLAKKRINSTEGNALDYTMFELPKSDIKSLSKYESSLRWINTSSYQRYRPLEYF